MNIDDSIPKRIGEFDIVRQIGNGGVGGVYETLQSHRNRRIALKLISSKHGLMTMAIERMRCVIEMNSSLHHLHIVPVFSAGEFALVSYFTMELVAGPSLAQVIRAMKLQRAGLSRAELAVAFSESGCESIEWALDMLEAVGSAPTKSGADGSTTTIGKPAASPEIRRFRKIAEMMADVADALAYAHGKGIVHRDIKPTNLLLSPDGRLMLTDFGLANLLQQPGMTLCGTRLCTPMYMSPEQIKAGAVQPDHRTDLYSLGAVLFEWLALQTPFDGHQPDRLESQVLHDEPKSLRKIDGRIPRGLETICSKAMDKDPAKRYQTADQMRDDLHSFLSNRRIRTHGPGVGPRIRWLKKHRAASAVLTLGLVLTGALLGLTYRSYRLRQDFFTQQIERSINDAIATACAGDQVVPLTLIDKARTFGVSDWAMALIMGQRSIHSGHPEDAIAELQRGLRLKPDSIEIKTTLGRAFLDCGRLDEYEALRTELANAVPSSPREELFLGNWVSMFDPEEGLEILKDTFTGSKAELRNLARLFLSRARWQLAMDSFDLSSVEDAHTEAQFCYYYYRNNSYVAANDFQAMVVMALVLRDANKIERAETIEAEALAALFEFDVAYSESQSAMVASGWYASFIEEPEKRLAALQTAISRYEKRGFQAPTRVRESYALELLLNGKIEEAKQELNLIRATGATDMEFLLAVVSATDEHLGIDRAQDELNGLSDSRGIEAPYRPIGLLMLGKTSEAERLYGQLKESIILPAYRHEWHEKVMEFGSGQITTQELIASMDEPRVSHANRSQGHFFIGMHLLSEGNRAEAKVHLEQCLQALVFSSREYQAARFILKKWELDPAWPSWISPAERS